MSRFCSASLSSVCSAALVSPEEISGGDGAPLRRPERSVRTHVAAVRTLPYLHSDLEVLGRLVGHFSISDVHSWLLATECASLRERVRHAHVHASGPIRVELPHHGTGVGAHRCRLASERRERRLVAVSHAEMLGSEEGLERIGSRRAGVVQLRLDGLVPLGRLTELGLSRRRDAQRDDQAKNKEGSTHRHRNGRFESETRGKTYIRSRRIVITLTYPERLDLFALGSAVGSRDVPVRATRSRRGARRTRFVLFLR